MDRVKHAMRKKFFVQIIASWDILADPLFRIIWIASLASNIGTWMQSTGAAWVMTNLTHSSLLISLMQTATSLPVFFLGLPGGTLADIVDRKKLLIFAQIEMLIAATLLSITTFLHVVNPWLLISLTFLLGIGSAIMFPAWIAIIPETTEKKNLVKAMTLNSVSYNFSLAIGPAVAGIILSAIGAG